MKKMIAYMAAMVFVTAHASVASIIWGSSTWIVGDTDVSTEGTLHAAINPAGSTETINGVTFSSSDTNINVNGASSTDFINGPLLADLDPATGSYSNALETGHYQPTSLTLNGLTTGQEYLLQVWSSDAREATTAGVPGRYITLDDTATLQENHNNDHTASTFGQWVSGTFVASGASQTVSVKGFASDGTENSGNALINLVQVRAIPEAASATMILLSAGLLLVANRFMRA